MERSRPKAVRHMSRAGMAFLKPFLLDFEISFINIDANDPEWEIVDRLWNVLIFRPDIATDIEAACRGADIRMDTIADLLRAAIEAADWPEGLW